MSEDRGGPVESREWPSELSARAVSIESGAPRLCGYDVENDLAKHYAFAASLFLAFTGDLADERRLRAFERVMTFASAMTVHEAPMHAAILARTCGVRPGGTLGVAAITLGEHADLLLRGIGSSLDDSRSELALPTTLCASTEAERASVEALRRLVEPDVDVPALRRDPSRAVAVVAVLRACGLTTPFQLSAALTIARLPGVVAETAATKVADFKSYPMDVPHFEYDPTMPAQSGFR